ncbi:MAG: fumarylacetoacetate hydrolase family protein [Desulfobacteraceae bacterium]|nr:fumarylacetoacetate hydrolase family protein [Desulfobacteraceae bacterium]
MKKITMGNRDIFPLKIVCVGRNYVEHIHELGNEVPDQMVVFFKPNCAISTELNCLHQEEQLHYESELSFLYEEGRFSGVGLGLDLTKRDLQAVLKARGLPWERAKAFDNSAVFSEFVPLSCDMNSLGIKLLINDVLVQQGQVRHMIFSPDKILEELSTFITLSDGDIVMTGTPEGVGMIRQGDEFEGHILTDELSLITAKWTAK